MLFSPPLLLPFVLVSVSVSQTHGLTLSVPTAPSSIGTSIPIGWSADSNDPLSFRLQMVCVDRVTLEHIVNRGTASNTTGTVDYQLGCPGDHTMQAVIADGSSTTPFATSAHFDVVGGSSSDSVSSTSSPSSPSTPSATPSPSPPVAQPERNSNARNTAIILGAVLGTSTFILALLVIWLFLRLRRNRQDGMSGRTTTGFVFPGGGGSVVGRRHNHQLTEPSPFTVQPDPSMTWLPVKGPASPSDNTSPTTTEADSAIPLVPQRTERESSAPQKKPWRPRPPSYRKQPPSNWD
ncbi:hypothetical protein R3P38DRAFT_3117983 [Favolaschia claudopus]|uniref:Mid2 domain-containing protein n=1 Tax=Favolaschia claudopus TaxID=2862362 RepID=A0AAV9ZFF9_9AGAR